jgi:phage terminase large subunit-like protein
MDPKDLSPEELDQLLSNLEEIEKLSRKVYIPYDKQKAFHCAPNKIRAVFGGNRSGKSEMGINEAKFHSTGRYPEWYPEVGRFNTPTRGRVVVTDYKKGAGEVLVPKIEQWFEESDIIKIEKSVGNVSKYHIRHISGGVSTFDVMTHEQDTMQFEGWSGHWVWFDEPPPRDKYIACLRGTVDFDGRMFITATPISEPWLYDEIVLNIERDAWHIAVSIYDNPYLSKKAIHEFEISLTDEEKEARINGKFLHLTGRIYGELDTNIHLISQLPDGSRVWPTYFVLDPADRRPHHGVWAKLDPLGTLYVFDEFVYKGTIRDTSEQILIRERTNGINPDEVIRILDPNKGRTPSNVTGLRLLEEFATHEVYFTADVNDDITTGHLAVKGRLSFDKTREMSTFNCPKLYFIASKTRECVRQLLSYVWDDWRGRNQAGRSEKEVPKDLNKDMPDCIRYLCMSNPVYLPEEGPKTRFSGGGFTGWGK